MAMPALHSAAAAPTLGAGAESPDSEGDSSAATPAQIDALIEDLKNPERREALIDQLEALKQAQESSQPAANPLENLDPSQLLTSVGNSLQQLWQQLLSTDVMWLAQHLLLSLLILALVFVLHRCVRRGIQRIRSRLEQRGARGNARQGFRMAERIVLTTLLIVAVVLLLQIWGMSLVQWITQLTQLGWIRTAFTVALVGTATVLLWGLCDSLIAGAMQVQSNRLADVRQRSRLRTVTPLLQGSVRTTIAVLALLIILGQLGVNIGPLLAGAGIIGLAVGFAAQSLIKDLLIGVTLLLEDAASVGDFIDITGKSGTVEEMGIRMMRLRDLDGTMHLIPYSEVGTVSNLTKDYGYALLDIGVAYHESVDDVIEALVATARELRDDEDLGPLILEDLEVMGVNAFADSKVEIRVRLKTVPLERWRIAREYRRRIKSRFDEVGIEIPFPHRTLYFGADKSGHASPARVAYADSGADLPASD